MATEELKPPAGQEATFEVERLDWSSGRLEVTGRWFGIRGRRFIRPVLELEAGGRRHRLLATLEHKPWTAAEGEEWLAAFPWEGDPVDPTAAELAVGPDLTIELISPARDEDSDGDRAATGGSSRSGRARCRTRSIRFRSQFRTRTIRLRPRSRTRSNRFRPLFSRRQTR